MNIPQLNLPRKYVVLAQAIVSVLLLALALVFSLSPMLTIDTTAMQDDLRDNLEELLPEDAEGDVDIDEILARFDTIEVTMPKLVRAGYIGIKTISFTIKGVTSSLNDEEFDEQLEAEAIELFELISSDEGAEALVTVVAAFGEAADISTLINMGEDDLSVGDIIMLAIRLGVMLAMLVTIVVLPIILLVSTLISLISLLTHLQDPKDQIGRPSNRLIKCFALALAFSLYLNIFSENLAWGSGLTAIFAMAIVSITLNTIATRTRAYEPADFRYVTLLQGTSLLSLAGAILFFNGIVKARVLHHFFESFGSYTTSLLRRSELIEDQVIAYNDLGSTLNPNYRYASSSDFEPSLIYLIDVALIAVFAILVLQVVRSVYTAIMRDLSMASGKKAKQPGFIRLGITALITVAIPFAVSKLQHNITYECLLQDGRLVPSQTVNGAIFRMTLSTHSGLLLMAFGAVLILLAGILLVVLKKILCPGMDYKHEMQILSGDAPIPANAPLWGVPASAAEEAPAEEAPAEEAPAEEAPAEEAPAEEAPAEEPSEV